jgi:hypothetical protein
MFIRFALPCKGLGLFVTWLFELHLPVLRENYPSDRVRDRIVDMTDTETRLASLDQLTSLSMGSIMLLPDPPVVVIA